MFSPYWLLSIWLRVKKFIKIKVMLRNNHSYYMNSTLLRSRTLPVSRISQGHRYFSNIEYFTSGSRDLKELILNTTKDKTFIQIHDWPTWISNRLNNKNLTPGQLEALEAQYATDIKGSIIFHASHEKGFIFIKDTEMDVFFRESLTTFIKPYLRFKLLTLNDRIGLFKYCNRFYATEPAWDLLNYFGLLESSSDWLVIIPQNLGSTVSFYEMKPHKIW